MDKNKQTADLLPENFASLEEAAEFWDTHSLADYWEQTKEVDIQVRARAVNGFPSPPVSRNLYRNAPVKKAFQSRPSLTYGWPNGCRWAPKRNKPLVNRMPLDPTSNGLL